MNRRRKRIEKMMIDEVSTVRSGDDPQADIVICKTGDKNTGTQRPAGTMPAGTTHTEDSMPPELINKDELPPEVVEYIEGLEEIAADKLGLGSEDSGGDDTLSKEADDDGDEESDLEDILKSHPAVAEAISKAQQAADAANARAEEAEKIAKAEQARAERSEAISKAESLTMISQDTEKVADLLQGLKKADPKLAEEVEGILKTADAQLRESGLFDEIGKGAEGGGALDGKVEEIKKANPEMTHEQAVAAAYEADPSLYTDELKGN